MKLWRAFCATGLEIHFVFTEAIIFKFKVVKVGFQQLSFFPLLYSPLWNLMFVSCGCELLVCQQELGKYAHFLFQKN